MLIEENFNPKHKSDYFCIKSTFIKTTDKDGHTDEKLDGKCEPSFIRLKKHNEKCDAHEFIKIDDSKVNDDAKSHEKFMFLPSMQSSMRDGSIIIGQAGSGKTYTVDLYCQLYKKLNPTNEILFFTMNNAEIDRSLTKELYKFVPMQKFIDKLDLIKNNAEDMKNIGHYFSNSMLIFDDIGTLKANKKFEKIIWDFIDSAFENMRKHHVSLLVITHSSRLGTKGTISKEEINRYCIVGSSLQTLNDRILDTTLGWNNKTIKMFFSNEINTRWRSIELKKKVIITEKVVYTTDYLYNRIDEKKNNLFD